MWGRKYLKSFQPWFRPWVPWGYSGVLKYLYAQDDHAHIFESPNRDVALALTPFSASCQFPTVSSEAEAGAVAPSLCQQPYCLLLGTSVCVPDSFCHYFPTTCPPSQGASAPPVLTVTWTDYLTLKCLLSSKTLSYPNGQVLCMSWFATNFCLS